MEATGYRFANRVVGVLAQAGHGRQQFALEMLGTHERCHRLSEQGIEHNHIRQRMQSKLITKTHR